MSSGFHAPRLAARWRSSLAIVLCTVAVGNLALVADAQAPSGSFDVIWRHTTNSVIWAASDEDAASSVTYLVHDAAPLPTYQNDYMVNLTAIDGASGSVVWSRPARITNLLNSGQPAETRRHAPLHVAPSIGDSNASCVVLVVGFYFVQGFDCATGDLRWNRSDVVAVYITPGSFDAATGYYYVAPCTQQGNNAWAVALDVRSGDVVWNMSIAANYPAQSYVGSRVVAFHTINHAYFFDKLTGRNISSQVPAAWENYGWTNYFVCGGDTFVLMQGATQMMTLNMTTGSAVWSRPGLGNFTTAGGASAVHSFIVTFPMEVLALPCRLPADLNASSPWPTPLWSTPGTAQGSQQQYNTAALVIPAAQRKSKNRVAVGSHRNEDGVVIAPLSQSNDVFARQNNSLLDLKTGRYLGNLNFSSQLNDLQAMVTVEVADAQAKPRPRRVLWTFVNSVHQDYTAHAVAIEVDASGRPARVLAQLPDDLDASGASISRGYLGVTTCNGGGGTLYWHGTGAICVSSVLS